MAAAHVAAQWDILSGLSAGAQLRFPKGQAMGERTMTVKPKSRPLTRRSGSSQFRARTASATSQWREGTICIDSPFRDTLVALGDASLAEICGRLTNAHSEKETRGGTVWFVRATKEPSGVAHAALGGFSGRCSSGSRFLKVDS